MARETFGCFLEKLKNQPKPIEPVKGVNYHLENPITEFSAKGNFKFVCKIFFNSHWPAWRYGFWTFKADRWIKYRLHQGD